MIKSLLLKKPPLLLATLMFIAILTTVSAQTLSPGDIAIIGMDTTTEELLLVALSDIPEGEIVFLGDNDWAITEFNDFNEGTVQWITPSITAGDVFILNFGTNSVTGISGANQGTVTEPDPSVTLSNSGDNVFIYQSSTNTYNSGTVTFIAAATDSASMWGTLDGTGLTLGTTAILTGSDDYTYTGTRAGQDVSTFLSLIYSTDQITTSGSGVTLDTTDFTFLASDCNISLDTASYTCTSNTLGNNNDNVVINVPYTGIQNDITAVTSTTSGAIIGGDNPALVSNGTITITGLSEGDSWNITIEGGSCDGLTTNGTVEAAICDPELSTCFDLSDPSDELFELVGVTLNSQNDEWTFSAGTYEINGYCGSGCSEATDAWLIFGPLDMSTTTDLALSFDATRSFSGTNLNIKYTNAYSGCPSSTSWTAAQSILSTDSYEVDLSDMSGTDVFIGIEYNDDDGTYASWSISNILLQTYSTCPTLGVRPTSDCGVCDLTFGEASYSCNAVTTGLDEVTISIPYSGIEPSIVSFNSISGGIIGGDDPSVVANGTITISGLSEGDDWDLLISGGDCDGSSISGTISNVECLPDATICYDLSNGTEPFELVTVTTNSGGNEWENISGTYSLNGYCGFGCEEEIEGWLIFGPLDMTATSDLILNLTATESFGETDLNIQYTSSYSGCPASSSWTSAQVITSAGEYNIDLSAMSGTEAFIGIQYQDDGLDNYSSWSLSNITLQSFSNCPALGSRPTSDCGVCEVTLGEASYTCEAETYDNDGVTISIPYIGSESTIVSLTSTASGAVVGGDNPAVTADGTITITGLVEGDNWNITINGGDCDGTTISGTISGTLCPGCPAAAGELIITEIMQNPSAVSDANGEYFEVYNTTDTAIDMQDLILKSNNDSNHTISSSVIVPAGGYVIFAKNGTTSSNGGVTVDYNYPSSFNLGNGADLISINCLSGTVIDEVAYDGGSSFPDPDGASMTLNSDSYTATANDNGSNWSESVVPFGLGDKGSPGYEPLTWSGIVSSNWNIAGNWSGNTIPTASSSVYIPASSALVNQPVISTTGVSILNLGVDSGSTVTVSSGLSLIVTGNSNGVITVERALSNNWHLISSPVAGESLQDFIASSNLASGTGSNIGLAPYNTTDDTWSYASNSTTGTWASGKGYSVLLTSNGTVSFTGQFPTSNVSISLNTGGLAGYNLVGNPYPSYIDGTALLNANNSVLEESTLWFWNNDHYETVNLLNAGKIAPAQGFIVSSNGSGSFSISESLQSHNTGTFYLDNTAMFTLQVDNGATTTDTDLYLVNNATTGYDNGYDSSMFLANSNNLAVYTKTVANDFTNPLAIQALPLNEFSELHVPVGLINTNGGSVTFALAPVQNIPDEIHVYLHDVVNSTVTELTNGASYTISTSSNFSSEDQFYLGIVNELLGNDKFENNSIKVATNGKNLVISGIENKANLTVYNMLGQKMMQQTLTEANTQDIQTNLPSGSYIVSITSQTGIWNKKLIIK